MNPFKWLFNIYINWAYKGYEETWRKHRRLQRIKRLQEKVLEDIKRI
jgi:hypothetical protein